VGLVAAMVVPEIALRRLGPSAFSWVARAMGRLRRRRQDAPDDRGEA
jgi:hypothetical protein